MIEHAAVLLLTFGSIQAVDFICPTNTITPVVLQGSLPSGSNELTFVPQLTDCTFSFDIPNGYALFVQLSVDFKSDNDTVSVIDTTNKTKHFNHSGKPTTAPVWFAADNAQIRVVGVSGNSRFFAKYEYKFLNDYKQKKRSTGDYFSLSLLSNKNYYTFTSEIGDKVVATTGRRSSGQVDYELEHIFVYDGDDISTSKMIGTLDDFGSSNIMSSSQSSMTLVNFYGTKSLSYVIGNDASTVTGYFKYNVIITSSGTGIHGTMGDLTGLIGAYTFICTDCNRFYFTQLDFDGLVIIDSAFIKLQGQTPTHKREKLITYSPSIFKSDEMPQLIPTGIFTLTAHLAKINFNITTVSDDTLWKTPYHGRKGYIFSTNLWNQNAIPNNFNYDFRNDSQLYTYSVNMDKMSFGSNTDNMTLQIGSGIENLSVDNQYPRDGSSTKNVSSVGNFMRIGLRGSANDDIRLSFEMRIYSSAASFGILTSTIFTFLYLF